VEDGRNLRHPHGTVRKTQVVLGSDLYTCGAVYISGVLAGNPMSVRGPQWEVKDLRK